MRHMTSLYATKFQVKWDGTKFHPTEINWIPRFQLLVAFKPQCNASSWSVLTIMSANSSWLYQLLVLRNLFTFFSTELTFTISSWFEHSPFFPFRKYFYACVHLSRAVCFWLWPCVMISRGFRFMSFQAKSRSPFLPNFSCIQKTSREI